MGKKVVGVIPSGPLKANSGVRSGVAAAGKVLEGDDQQIYVHYITIINFKLVQLTCPRYASTSQTDGQTDDF